MKFLCLKAALIYGSKYLEGSWTAYAFSETAIEEGVPSLLVNNLSNHELSTRCIRSDLSSFLSSYPQIHLESHDYPYNNYATIVPMGTSCLESWYFSVQDPPLGNTINDFPPSSLYSTFCPLRS